MFANIVDKFTFDGRSVPFVETHGLPFCRDARSVRLLRRSDRPSLQKGRPTILQKGNDRRCFMRRSDRPSLH